MAKDKEEKPKMSKGKKIIAGLLVALTIAGAAVGAAIAITNSLNNTQGNAGPGTSFAPRPDRPSTPSIPGGGVDQDNDQDLDQDNDQDNDQDINQGNGNGGQDDPVTPPEIEYTEAEYKEMFETNILAAIQNDYNEGRTDSRSLISDLKLELINYETGDVYFTCERNGSRKMFIANHEEIADWATYEALNENFPMDGFEFSSAYTVQEDGLAEEIAQFALTQTAVQTYAKENNIDLSDYTVINATEFKGTTKGAESDIVLLTEEGVLTLTLVGSTGACGSQEEYLAKLKTSSRVEISNINLVEHYEIPTGTAESSADYGFEF